MRTLTVVLAGGAAILAFNMSDAMSADRLKGQLMLTSASGNCPARIMAPGAPGCIVSFTGAAGEKLALATPLAMDGMGFHQRGCRGYC